MSSLDTFTYEERILIVGESKSGKTYLASKIGKLYSRVIVISPYRDEFVDFKNVVHTAEPETAYRTIQIALNKGSVMLILDDCDLYLENFINDPNVKKLLIGSRHYEVGYIAISRRFADVPKLLVKQCNKIFMFQTDLKLDIKTIQDNYGESIAEEVKDLNRPKFEFIYLNRETKRAIKAVA